MIIAKIIFVYRLCGYSDFCTKVEECPKYHGSQNATAQNDTFENTRKTLEK